MITGASTLIRTLLIYCICIPLAVFVGYVLTDPLNASTFVEMGLVLFCLLLPVLLKWHREMLLISWNLGAMLFFLPGRPQAWLAFAWISFTFAVAQYILNPRQKFISVPSITRPLVFIVVVVVATALLSGGIGLYALGSETYGGKKYLVIITSVIGYFAITSKRLAPRRANLLVILFLVSSATQLIGDIAGVLAPGLYYIYLIFPIGEYGYENIVTDFSSHGSGIARMGGVSVAAAAAVYAMLARYGIANIFDSRKLLRLGIFAALLVASLLGGFRSVLILFALTFAIIFYLEGLFRTRLLPVLAVLMLLLGIVVVGFSERMPLNVQRAISFLPVAVDRVARASAEESTTWRLEMWKEVIPQVPSHLVLGKGLAFSGAELESLEVVSATGRGSLTHEGAALAGDYHNGPLSLIVPFGIWGVIGFIWFLGASLRVLYYNWKFGHPAFKRVNTFLFGYFLAKTLFFFLIFGSFYSDLATFTGLIALSVSLNGGVAQPVFLPRILTAGQRPFKIHPSRRPAGVMGHA